MPIESASRDLGRQSLHDFHKEKSLRNGMAKSRNADVITSTLQIGEIRRQMFSDKESFKKRFEFINSNSNIDLNGFIPIRQSSFAANKRRAWNKSTNTSTRSARFSTRLNLFISTFMALKCGERELRISCRVQWTILKRPSSELMV